jgi:hypothetical protein
LTPGASAFERVSTDGSAMRGGATVANEACAVARAYGGSEVFGGVAAKVECVEPMLIPSKAGALQSVSPCLGFAPHNPERSNHFDALEEDGNLLAGGIRLNMPPPRRTALLQTRQGRRICGPHCQGLRVEASAYLSLRWHSTIRSAASPVTTRPKSATSLSVCAGGDGTPAPSDFETQIFCADRRASTGSSAATTPPP